MPAPRLMMLTGLAVAGALCAGTAASVYAASLPRRDVHDAHVHRRLDGSWDLGADPADPEIRLRAADRTLPTRLRLDAAWLIAAGACLQPREMLFGSSARRYAALDSLVPFLSDLPAAEQAVVNSKAVLRAFDTGAMAMLDTPEVPSALVPDVLIARLDLCRQLGGRESPAPVTRKWQTGADDVVGPRSVSLRQCNAGRQIPDSCVRTNGDSLLTGAFFPPVMLTHSLIDAPRITTTDTRKKAATPASS